MKRLFALIAVITVLLSMIPFAAQASETDQIVTHFEDGSYLVTETEVSNSRMMTKVASKTATYYSADDEVQWKMFITGEFLYDGTTCTCTYASGKTTIYNNTNWRMVSDYASYSGNTASYTTRFNTTALGVVIGPYTQTVTITCDENGNIS